MRLVYLGLAWLLGACTAMWIDSPWGVAAAVAGAALLGLLLYRGRVVLLVLCLALLIGGALRHQLTIAAVDEGDIRYYNESGAVWVRGVVAADPEPAGSRVALRLESVEIDIGGDWREVSGAALVYAPGLLPPGSLPADAARDSTRYLYGDLLLMRGELATPPALEDFDWRGYLARQGVYSLIESPRSMDLLASGQGSTVQEWVHQLRGRMSRSLEASMHEPQASLAKALLLGDRSSVPQDLRDDLSRTGTAHMIAVSGLHIFIVGGVAFSFGAWLLGRRRPVYLLVALGTIWGYAFLTGMHAPVFRAAIMGSLWLMALHLGRPRSSLAWLLFAAAIMVAVKPSILREVSFQMSFAAMTGIILLTPRFQSWGARLPGMGEDYRGWLGVIVGSFTITLGAVVAVSPLIAYYFGEVSLVALPANLFALPALPLAVGASALVAVIGIILAPLAQVLGWVAWLCTGWIIGVTEVFSSLPFAAVGVGDRNAAAVWVYYAVLGAGLWLVTGWIRSRALTAGARTLALSAGGRFGRVPAGLIIVPLVVLAGLSWAAAVAAPDGRVHVFILDVGQGDAVLVQRGQMQVLVDGGPDPERICLELGERMPFWDRRVELVVSTHPHADHLTGLVEVVGRYDVGMAVMDGQAGDSLLQREWLRQIEAAGIEQLAARAGQRIDLGDGLFLEVLHPPATPLDGTVSDADNNCLVARLVYRDFSLLLTGDIHEEAERYLLDRRCTLDSTVLKVPHHGSDTSCCPEFVASVDAQLAVISVGADNYFGHPGPDVLERLSEAIGADGVYLTSEHGAIELITDGTTLWVRSER